MTRQRAALLESIDVLNAMVGHNPKADTYALIDQGNRDNKERLKRTLVAIQKLYTRFFWDRTTARNVPNLATELRRLWKENFYQNLKTNGGTTLRTHILRDFAHHSERKAVHYPIIPYDRIPRFTTEAFKIIDKNFEEIGITMGSLKRASDEILSGGPRRRDGATKHADTYSASIFSNASTIHNYMYYIYSEFWVWALLSERTVCIQKKYMDLFKSYEVIRGKLIRISPHSVKIYIGPMPILLGQDDYDKLPDGIDIPSR